MTQKAITIQYSGVQGQQKNTSYPFKAEITCIDDMKKVAAFDHVCATYADGKNTRGKLIKGYRSKKTFEKANCLPMDVDNAVSDPLAADVPPEQWKTPADVAAAFPDVPFYVVYSRNHMKEKGGKAARPKFHVYFIMSETESAARVAELKAQVQQYFPSFDIEALDAARFLFGVDNPQVEYFDGNMPVDVFMDKLDSLPGVIPIGQRHGTLVRYASRVLTKYGDKEETCALYEEAAARCEEPLENDELSRIWQDACHYYHETIEKNPDYISPDEYAAMDFADGGKKKKKPVTSEDIKAIMQKLNIKIRLNEITGMADIEGMPAQFSKTNAVNVLPVLLSDYMKTHDMKCAKRDLDDSLVLIEDENRYNPFADMLKETVYDGTDRIAELPALLDLSDTDFEFTLVKKWLWQTVSIALNDETEPYGADGVLTLQGAQGIGKTRFFSVLSVYPDWFAEGVSINTENKDTIIQATGSVVAELGELDSTLKREQSALKAFLTAARDTYRLPYARAAARRPRRTSFCATVNPDEFLNDETGTRRFWVVHVGKIDVDRLNSLPREWVMQLWAQVYQQYYLKDVQGFRLTKEERAELECRNAKYSKPLPGELEIMDIFNWETPIAGWQWLRVRDIQNLMKNSRVTPVQIGKAISRIASRDERIQLKTTGNVKQYLLPKVRCTDFMHLYESDTDSIIPMTG